MTGPDATELDDLRAKAYGPAGALTDAEAARLAELQDAARAKPPEQAGPEEHLRAEDADVHAARAITEPVAADSTAGPAGESSVAGPRRRRRWLIPMAAVLLAAIVGAVVGWSVATNARPAGIELTTAQQAWQDELEASGEYDPGSIRALAVQPGLITSTWESPVAWTATQERGERLCFIVGDDVGTSGTCVSEYEARRRTPAVAHQFADDDDRAETSAVALAAFAFTPDGDLAAHVDVVLVSVTNADEFVADVIERDMALLGASKSVTSAETVGSFEGSPVWLTTGPGDLNCLAYLSDSYFMLDACAPAAELPGSSLTLGLIESEGGAVDAGTKTTFDLSFAVDGTRQLVIIRTPNESDSN